MNFRLGSVSIDPVELGSRGNAVLGIRDSGKTVTAKVLAEHLHDAGIPLVVFDPSGMWRFLRVPGKGKGRPVVVAGGKDGDLPLTPASAPKIVEAAMQAGLSLVLHLDMSLSKTDWRAIVRDSVRLLMQRNSEFGLRHVILEEAAEFVPQVVRGDIATVYSEVERMIRIGGNAGLGCTLVNQRAEEVNKAVLELCDNLFLHRQKGRNSITALSKWLDIGAAKDGKTVTDSMSTLPSGECWAWLHGSDQPVRIKVPMCDSLHPNRRDLRAGNVAAKVKPVPMEGFVEKLRAQLPAIEEQRKASDPAELRKRIAELEKEKKSAQGVLGVSEADLKAEYERGYSIGHKAGIDQAFKVMKRAKALLEHVATMATQGAGEMEIKETEAPKTPARAIAQPRPAAATPLPPRAAAENSSGDLPAALQRAVNAIGWWRQIGHSPVDRSRAAVVAGYSPKASTFGVYIADLVKRGLVAVSPGKVALTDEGIAAAIVPSGDTREQIREVARGLLSAQEQRVFDVVYAAHPEEIARSSVAEAVGLSPIASTAGVYIAGVAAYGIIEPGSRGHVRAANWLFP